jgi:splicing factor U2AF subunit
MPRTTDTCTTWLQIFIGGLPYGFDEGMCRQLLESYGELQSFELVRDREKGESKGYGFAIYVDGAITETAIVGLNGLSVEGRVLTARRYALHLCWLCILPNVWFADSICRVL